VPLFDFKCECGKIFERFQKADHEGENRMAMCECGKMAPWMPSNGASFKFTFRDGYDVCTGEYHPTKRHYEECKRRKGLVKVE